MKTLHQAAQAYVALRRSLGFKLKIHQRLLEDFVSFLGKEGERRITSNVALRWATKPQHLQPSEWAARLSIVRGFARYGSATDPTTEIPLNGMLSSRRSRPRPYIYSEEQIKQLLEAARGMRATHSLQPWTYHCLIGLLAVSGLRISEALNLRPEDVDWSEGVLSIRKTKFRKARLIPLHSSTLKVISDYADHRDRIFEKRNYFFPSRFNGRLDEGQVRRTFYTLSRQIGIRGISASRGPRLHDFRQHAESRIMPTLAMGFFGSFRLALPSKLG